MSNSKAITGQDFLLTRKGNPSVWTIRTQEEVDALHAEDARAGRYHDDAGEPILHGPYGNGWPDGAISLTVRVTSRRPKWKHWNRRPKNLREGWCPRLNRTVLFQAP